MKFVVYTHHFHPEIGGIETLAETLARQFVCAGHEATVLTWTAEPGRLDYGFPVVRRPTLMNALRLVGRADVYIQLSGVRLSLPVLWHGDDRWIVSHQTYTLRRGIALRAVRVVQRLACNVACSQWVARRLNPLPCHVIPNTYRSDLFELDPASARERDFVFVGRLVPEKGLSTLLHALARLDARAWNGLTVAGLGPERDEAERLSRELALERKVDFVGPVEGKALAELLNGHRVMVAPSLWEEPFGIVALEGLACGCLPVVSRRGGLIEAAGPTAIPFDNGDVAGLTGALAMALHRTRGAPGRALEPQVSAHLRRHLPERVAADYLALAGNRTTIPSFVPASPSRP